jgi:hypothetical protein
MIYSLSLETALLLVGAVLLIAHLAALLAPGLVQKELREFPRSRLWGTVLISAAGLWFWWLVATMDLGEFTSFRRALKIGTPICAVLLWMYVEEFLAVRALGMLVLLGAEALLEAAWMRPEMSRLWLVSLVYVWVTAALFWVGMPYTLRDQIAWVTKTPGRWKAAAWAGAGYGAILLVCALRLRH